MGVEYFIHLEFCHWMCKVIFLKKIIAFIYELCLLYFQVMLHTIYSVLEKVTQMFSSLYPGQWIATENQWGDISLLL